MVGVHVGGVVEEEEGGAEEAVPLRVLDDLKAGAEVDSRVGVGGERCG